MNCSTIFLTQIYTKVPRPIRLNSQYFAFFKVPNRKVITVKGKIRGKISHKILGKKGFGYDPIFIPNSYRITFGEMNKFKKIKMDHRFIAFKKLKKKIRTL